MSIGHVVRPSMMLLPRRESSVSCISSSSSRRIIVRNSSRRCLPVLTTTTHQQARPHRRCIGRQYCAADDDQQPSPDNDPVLAYYHRFRDEMDKFEREYGAALRAVEGSSSQEAMVAELELTLFRDEDDKLAVYIRQIASNRCILYREGNVLAFMVCSRVRMAIHLSALVTASAHLGADESSGFSFHTVEQIIRTYVCTFLKTAEDTCHRKLDRTSIILFLDALRGLAAVSHILAQDTLDAINKIEDCSKSFDAVFDVDTLNRKLQCNMKELEMRFTGASDGEAYELLWSTLSNATDHVSLFVFQMRNLRRRALTHVQNHVKGNTIGKEYANDEKEHKNDYDEHNNDGDMHDAS